MNFLEPIVAEKRAEVAARAQVLPFAKLAQRVGPEGVRDFRAAVATPGAIIAELKARTPTIAAFAHSRGLSALAGTYTRNGAAAISIVTDPRRFGTSLEDLARLREATTLPMIAKDFVIDPYQILEARASGADAVLLIVRLLSASTLRSLLGLVGDLGMVALVETHTEAELLVALGAGAQIVGINNRDLDTMTVSLDVTRRLAPRVPEDVILVSESGIRTRGDIEELGSRGVRAFLVGGSLLDAQDPGAKLRELTGQAEFVRRRAGTGDGATGEA